MPPSGTLLSLQHYADLWLTCATRRPARHATRRYSSCKYCGQNASHSFRLKKKEEVRGNGIPP